MMMQAGGSDDCCGLVRDAYIYLYSVHTEGKEGYGRIRKGRREGRGKIEKGKE
jgi:hypothetical protein